MGSYQRPITAICQIGYIRKIAAKIGTTILGDRIFPAKAYRQRWI